jgi:alpha-galactosidase
MQLDHGWQRGDVTGDWTPNERFPHGLKWLANELKSRFGFRLGLWISPTDVAETSETFKKHPDWMLKDAAGKPLVNWRWYWKPNPNCYELDASNPAARQFVENTFERLAGEGASYFKIDFIAASAGEQFFPSDPTVTRGWGVFQHAVEAVRRGAGQDATIRYCQVPSLLAAGVADYALGGSDTLDAGLNGNIEVLRENARHLAASYWANGRLYQREVCDMSVRMQADVEEARLRLALMTLGGCSISFSDELQHLPASRIRMMQSCLPPGNPPMKPLDLFDREIPSIWRLHCRPPARDVDDEWDIVGLFNFENKAEERTVDFAPLGLAKGIDASVFEFWEEKFLGVHRDKIMLTLPPQTSRILSIRKLSDHPQLVGADMHLLQGFHELKRLHWDEKTQTLSGVFERAGGLDGKAFIYIPANYAPHFDFPLKDTSAHLTRITAQVWAHEFRFQNARYEWRIPFDKSDK